ncbi:MAG TPA: hypothetical protein PKC91_10285 [Ignavibacteria bacterium]|nr:hypothetical protein [Ignavibacteria bacterium]
MISESLKTLNDITVFEVSRLPAHILITDNTIISNDAIRNITDEYLSRPTIRNNRTYIGEDWLKNTAEMIQVRITIENETKMRASNSYLINLDADFITDSLIL